MADYVPFSGSLDGEDERFVPFTGELDQTSPRRSRTMTEELLRQAGRFTRMGINSVTGTGQILADAPFNMTNIIFDQLNKLGPEDKKRPLKPLPVPSRELNKTMDRAGLPNPETPMEHITDFIGTAIGGARDPLLRGAQALTTSQFPAPQPRAQDPAITGVTRELMDSGVKLPPSRTNSTGPARVLEGFGGQEAIEKGMSKANQTVFQNTARHALGLPDNTPLTPEVLGQQRNYWYQQGYAPLESVGMLGIGSRFRSDMARIVARYGGSGSFPQAGSGIRGAQGQGDPVRQLVDSYLFDTNGRYLRNFQASDAINHIKNLRAEASAHFQGKEPTLGHVKNDIARALEDNIELNLNSSRLRGLGLVDRFKRARAEMAKNHAVEDMLVDPNTGIIDPGKAYSLQRAGRPLSDGLETIAKAGSPVYGRATRAPTGGDPLPLNNEMGNWGMGGAAMGYFSGQPLLGAVMAGVPAARAGARSLISSPWYQNRLAQNLSSPPGFLGSPAGQRSLAAGGINLFGLPFQP